MGKANRKLQLFRSYRKNIELLCENPNYKRDVLQDIVICPICFHTFRESDVKKSDERNYLTIEHVPPKYLGGKTEILTCFKCNNLFSEFDKELDHISLKRNSKVYNWRAKVQSGADRFGAMTQFDFEKNELQLKFGNNEDLLKFIESIRGENEFKFEVKDKTKAVGVNILKMAYLLAFHKFGYGLIMQPQYNFIREQIKNPYQNVLDNYGLIYFNETGTALPEGIFLVKEPSNLISLMVRFKVVKKDGTPSMYSVHLPSPGVNVVEFYKKLTSVYQGTKYLVTDFANVDYWHDRNFIYAPILEIDRYLKFLGGA